MLKKWQKSRIAEFLMMDLHQSYMVVTFFVGIIAGAILAMVFRINYFGSAIWVGLVLLLLLLSYCKPKFLMVVVALVAGMILVFYRVTSDLKGEEFIRTLVGQNVVVAGTIKGDPETDENETKIKLQSLSFGEEKIVSAGSLFVSVAKNEDLARGDRVVLSGRMDEGFGTYAGYMYKPRTVKWEKPEPGDFVLGIRNWFAKRIEDLVSQPEVKLGLSYLLGMKSGLPDDLNDKLRVVGLVHIVVASGAHLSILVEVAKKIFGKISRFAGLLFSVLFILFFMCMVGWTPSILRAGVMAILSLLAWYYGRKIAPWRLIVIVAGFTLLLDPSFVLNMGWLLSFASYAGIMILGPRLNKFFYGEDKPKWIASMIITTMSATIMTLPITLYYYGQMSLISVIANLIILPTLPWAMGLVFATGVVASIPGISFLVAKCAEWILRFHIIIVGWFGEMKQFLVEIPKYQWWVFFIYLLIVGCLMIGIVRKLCYNENHE